MGLISFIQEAGEKLFGIGKADAAEVDMNEVNQKASNAITAYIDSMGLKVDGLNVAFDGGSKTVSVSGTAPDQATREKVVLCCGNVAHVDQVNDLMTVANNEPESQYHTVEKGDNLSKISQTFYGTANKYMVIFEANKPMLSHPDKIYPGQVLRIPPQ